MGVDKTVTCRDIKGKSYTVPVSELRWRPSAYGIVIKDGNLLTAKHFGRNNLPGGGLELGELPEAAVIREVKEETGIDVTQPKLLTLTSHFFKMPWTDHRTDFCQTLLLYYACDFAGGEFSMAGFDVDEQVYAEMPEWYPLSKLSSLKIAGSHDWRPIVAELIKNK